MFRETNACVWLPPCWWLTWKKQVTNLLHHLVLVSSLNSVISLLTRYTYLWKFAACTPSPLAHVQSQFNEGGQIIYLTSFTFFQKCPSLLFSQPFEESLEYHSMSVMYVIMFGSVWSVGFSTFLLLLPLCETSFSACRQPNRLPGNSFCIASCQETSCNKVEFLVLNHTFTFSMWKIPFVLKIIFHN